MSEYNVLKVALIGATESGKSSLMRSISGRPFEHTYMPTIGADLGQRIISDEHLRILIWDLAGNPHYATLIRSYIKMCDLCVLVYDSTNYNSYHTLYNLYTDIKTIIEDKPLCIVSTKTDMNSTLQEYEWGRDIAIRLNCPFFSTAAYRHRYDEFLNWIIDIARKRYNYYPPQEHIPIIIENKKCPKFCIIQ